MFSAFLSCLSNLLLQGHKDVPVVFLGNLHCFYFPRAIYPELTLVGDCGKDPDPFFLTWISADSAHLLENSNHPPTAGLCLLCLQSGRPRCVGLFLGSILLTFLSLHDYLQQKCTCVHKRGHTRVIYGKNQSPACRMCK